MSERAGQRRQVLAWAFYDWANSAFATIVLAAFFPLFFKEFWSTGVEATVSTFRLGVTNAVGSLLIASAVFFSHHEEGLSLHEILVTLFLFITAPVGAHLMAKAALHLRLSSRAELPDETLLDGGQADANDDESGRH